MIIAMRREPRVKGGRRTRRVVEGRDGQFWLVSTIPLLVDHRVSESDPPLWYETMVFPCDAAGEPSSWLDLYRARYSTWEAALAGHWRISAGVAAGAIPRKTEES